MFIFVNIKHKDMKYYKCKKNTDGFTEAWLYLLKDGYIIDDNKQMRDFKPHLFESTDVTTYAECKLYQLIFLGEIGFSYMKSIAHDKRMPMTIRNVAAAEIIDFSMPYDLDQI